MLYLEISCFVYALPSYLLREAQVDISTLTLIRVDSVLMYCHRTRIRKLGGMMVNIWVHVLCLVSIEVYDMERIHHCIENNMQHEGIY